MRRSHVKNKEYRERSANFGRTIELTDRWLQMPGHLNDVQLFHNWICTNVNTYKQCLEDVKEFASKRTSCWKTFVQDGQAQPT
ncbi:hypothetical protein Y032_0247g51 [Ancylostoma ceylanicum]|uniref:Uncharacterized protein n=1 Tax=Ancylostoma ceylanicum TaxID=53326 RepID=A0A016SDK1_9BILA|nr:hypothetical protein Y032_0247g51 [Ancylostoma ceylanicum]